MALNILHTNLRSSRIYPGQRLKISGSKNVAYSGKSSSRARKYRVRAGDSLYSIAKKFGTSIAMIKKVNRMKRTTIYPGQMIKL